MLILLDLEQTVCIFSNILKRGVFSYQKTSRNTIFPESINYRYANSLSCVLPFPTSFALDLFNFELDILRSTYREVYAYKKCGVFLSKIVPQEVLQADLFGDYSLEREYTKARLMCVVDLLNEWWGSNTLFFGAQGIGRA